MTMMTMSMMMMTMTMMMIKALLITICILILAPYLAFAVVKWGATGYYSAQRMWKKPHDNNNSEIKE